MVRGLAMDIGCGTADKQMPEGLMPRLLQPSLQRYSQAGCLAPGLVYPLLC